VIRRGRRGCLASFCLCVACWRGKWVGRLLVGILEIPRQPQALEPAGASGNGAGCADGEWCVWCGAERRGSRGRCTANGAFAVAVNFFFPGF